MCLAEEEVVKERPPPVKSDTTWSPTKLENEKEYTVQREVRALLAMSCTHTASAHLCYMAMMMMMVMMIIRWWWRRRRRRRWW
jgi:hypothetical protein